MLNSYLPALIIAALLASCNGERVNACRSSVITPPFMHRSADEDGNNLSEMGDRYDHPEENPYFSTSNNSISTFSTDADGASYTNTRRFIMNENQLPPREAVRTEELINFFDMQYTHDQSGRPVSLNSEVSTCPWSAGHKLLRIGIRGMDIPKDQLPTSNYVFLIDVSGSMSDPDKLSLLKEGFERFTEQLNAKDRVAIVTYAGYSEIALPSTLGSEKVKIKEVIRKLGSGGGTAGAEGIVTAYKIAKENLVRDGNNRVILATDGDFNIGISDKESLVKLLEEQRKSGIFLTVLGVGRGNLNDAAMEQMADNGNGSYEYIDKADQLDKVFIEEKNKFYPVAKDVKIEVKFDPQTVDSFRLIGYENRMLTFAEFSDDNKDAGEISSGQSLTALYEIILKPGVINQSVHIAIIDFRYKPLDEMAAKQFNVDVFDFGQSFENASGQMKLAGSITAFSMLITNSRYKGTSSFANTGDWLKNISLPDPYGRVGEFREIVKSASVYK